jgi:hypothetical protein
MTASSFMRPLLTCLPLLLAIGCGGVQHGTGQWAGFESHRLSNGTVEIEVVPAIGRIIRYGYAGEQNLLWTDPDAPNHPLYGWTNWGGDKIWLWPQTKWTKTWPPVIDRPALKHTAVVCDGEIELRSPPLPDLGVRIVRRIRLESAGTRVHITSRVEPVDSAPPADLVLWQVTQLPVPDRMSAVADLAGVCQHDEKAHWPGITQAGREIVLPRPDFGTKVGFESTDLRAVIGRTVFTQTLTPAAGKYEPGEQAQIFIAPNEDNARPKELPPYVEYEFIAPYATPPAELRVTWELSRVR